jgi:hypothetical protein
LQPEEALLILDNLFSDKTRFVTRSVANHVNDISKINPSLAIATLARWKKSGKQNSQEMNYITNHALRSLIKIGNKDAISFLNLSTDPAITISHFKIKSPVHFGELLEFSFILTAKKDEELILDYVLHFPNKTGNRNSKKVFKIKKITLQKNQTLDIKKTHRMLQVMTTRTLYPGEHKIELQINGKKVAEKMFDLREAQRN